MKNNSYVIERMTPADMSLAVHSAKDLGWNPGIHDEKTFLNMYPSGFFVGKLDGKPIAFGSAVIYDESFAFCGFYMVLPDYRGQGYGLELTKARLKSIGSRNAGIDGVVEMVDKYERLGYQTAHRNVRYQCKMNQTDANFSSIKPLSEINFDEIVAYDSAHFPTSRALFLKHWLTQPDMKACASIDNGKLCGYGVIRKCFEGYKIGPLFAENPKAADELLCSLMVFSKGDNVYLDCPENNPHAMALVERYGFEKVFETARMYLKHEPDINMQSVYGITTLELG